MESRGVCPTPSATAIVGAESVVSIDDWRQSLDNLRQVLTTASTKGPERDPTWAAPQHFRAQTANRMAERWPIDTAPPRPGTAVAPLRTVPASMNGDTAQPSQAFYFL